MRLHVLTAVTMFLLCLNVVTFCSGDEASKVRVFKDVLGLSDEDAAPVHIEVGRRLSRIGFEYKDR
jgi:hypothetical protein